MAFPIVDAHQHFWDLDKNYHPWLADAPPASFRYGDTAPLRRNYLPENYFADSAAPSRRRDRAHGSRMGPARSGRRNTLA